MAHSVLKGTLKDSKYDSEYQKWTQFAFHAFNEAVLPSAEGKTSTPFGSLDFSVIPSPKWWQWSLENPEAGVCGLLWVSMLALQTPASSGKLEGPQGAVGDMDVA